MSLEQAYITPREAAAILGVAEKTIYKNCGKIGADGKPKIPSIKVGTSRKIPIKWLTDQGYDPAEIKIVKEEPNVQEPEIIEEEQRRTGHPAGIEQRIRPAASQPIPRPEPEPAAEPAKPIKERGDGSYSIVF